MKAAFAWAVALCAASIGAVRAGTPAAPFIIGGDVSSLPQVEQGGGVFKDHHAVGDALAILKAHGMTHARVRIWVDPEGGHTGLARTLAMARRLHDTGLPFLLDFHYSDTWADPAHQMKPAAWVDLHGKALEDRVFEYTRQVMAELDRQQTPPWMVQVGNEVTAGILWPDGKLGGKGEEGRRQWAAFGRLLGAGIRGVRSGREGKGRIPIMIHNDRGADNAACRWFFDHLASEQVDFDVIGLSYYPWWQGRLDKLRANLNDLSGRYRRDIILVEVGYPWTLQGHDDTGNIVGKHDQLHPGFAATADGQKAFLRELSRIVVQTPEGRGIGVFYWEPAWIAAPRAGSPWENMACFDFDGESLDSLEALRPPADARR